MFLWCLMRHYIEVDNLNCILEPVSAYKVFSRYGKGYTVIQLMVVICRKKGTLIDFF